MAVAEAYGGDVAAAQRDGVGPVGRRLVAIRALEDRLLLVVVGLRPRGGRLRILDIGSVDQIPVKAQVQADTVVA